MTAIAMRADRFARRLETAGPDLALWPAAERAAAEALLAVSPEARARHADALRLARAVEAALPHPDPAAVARLRASVAARIAREPLPAADTHRTRFGPLWQAGFGALAAALGCAAWLVLAAPEAPAPTVLAAAAGDPLALLLQPAPQVEDPL
jgi:hypothetical protein